MCSLSSFDLRNHQFFKQNQAMVNDLIQKQQMVSNNFQMVKPLKPIFNQVDNQQSTSSNLNSYANLNQLDKNSADNILPTAYQSVSKSTDLPYLMIGHNQVFRPGSLNNNRIINRPFDSLAYQQNTLTKLILNQIELRRLINERNQLNQDNELKKFAQDYQHKQLRNAKKLTTKKDEFVLIDKNVKVKKKKIKDKKTKDKAKKSTKLDLDKVTIKMKMLKKVREFFIYFLNSKMQNSFLILK